MSATRGLSIVEQKYHLQNLSAMALSTTAVASTCLQLINLIINIVVLPILLLLHTSRYPDLCDIITL